MAKPKTAPKPIPVRKKTSIGSSALSRLIRKGNRRKRYRGQGK